MNRKSRLITGIFAVAIALTFVSATSAQDRQVVLQNRVFQGPGGPEGGPPQDRTFVFVSSEMNFDGKLVKGAPYSAEAITETTQTLGDGNRIVNKSKSMLYRDSEGRTRREQSLRAIGPFAATGEPAQTIFINDPVAGVNYSLDSRSMVARKMLPMKFEFKFDKKVEGEKVVTSQARVVAGTSQAQGQAVQVDVNPEIVVAPMVSTHAATEAAPFVMEWHTGSDKTAKTESLGKQTIEGVEAEGTRTVTTIPAGELGNERAIEIVSERWYSPELQTVIMTRHLDPRFGETSYRLTNISRDEPARSLFEVPAGYTIKEANGPMQPMQLRTKKLANSPE